MMYLVAGSETYKTASGIVTQAMGKIDEVPVKTGGVQCLMTFMVVDTDSYDVLLGLDFLIKIGAIVDVEHGLIQVRHGPGTDVEVLPLTMVNMLQAVCPEGAKPMDRLAAGKLDVVMEHPQIDTRTRDQRPEPQMSESDSDSSENSEEEQQLQEPSCERTEFEDTELEQLVMREGPQQILQLTLQEQTDHIMKEEAGDSDDYADWIKWVADAERKKQTTSSSASEGIPALLQVRQLDDATSCNKSQD
jgi:hypothetical protein